jgi:hypothetical protein
MSEIPPHLVEVEELSMDVRDTPHLVEVEEL